MELREKRCETSAIGRYSDGSDHQVVTTWYVQAEHDGRLYALAFDHDPDDSEIADALAAGQGQEVITLEHLSSRLAATKAELFTTLEAAAYLYEQNLQLQDANLMSLEAIATLYEMLTGGEPQ